jgi:hypothetical protein
MKYVKDFEFSSSGPKQVRGYMRGGACGYAKGGAAKSAPKSLSIMVAVGTKKAAPSAKKSMPPVMAVPKKAAPSAKKSMPPVMAVPIGLKKGGEAAKGKVGVVMKEFGKGDLHSGSDKGPLVKNPKQAVAIALSEARNAKAPVKKAMGGAMVGGMMGAPGAGAVSDKEMQKLKKVAMPIISKMAAARGAVGPAAGLGAISNMEAANMAGARGAAAPAASAGALGAAAGPSRAVYDAMMAKRAAVDAARNKPYSAMTPAERNQISGGEGVAPMTGARFGRPYKKGGSTKC